MSWKKFIPIGFAMAKVSLFICSFFYFGFIIVQSQHSLDDVLLKFRRDYIDYKTKSIKSLDDLFFDVYIALDKSIDSSMTSYSKYNGTWNRICANISKTLDNGAKKRVQDTCDSMHSTIDLTYSIASRSMVSFYFGKLGSSSEFVDVAEDIFWEVEENMDTIPAMYNDDPKCVKPMLQKHKRTYSPLIDDITTFGRKSLDKMKTIFKSALKASEKVATSLSTTANSFNKCLKNSDPSKCVKDLVTNFRKFFDYYLIIIFSGETKN